MDGNKMEKMIHFNTNDHSASYQCFHEVCFSIVIGNDQLSRENSDLVQTVSALVQSVSEIKTSKFTSMYRQIPKQHMLYLLESKYPYYVSKPTNCNYNLNVIVIATTF